jgi:hypothetical protein
LNSVNFEFGFKVVTIVIGFTNYCKSYFGYFIAFLKKYLYCGAKQAMLSKKHALKSIFIGK